MTVGAAPRSGRFPTLAKYDVLEELGHGGMATVYRAHDRRLGRDVAVKVIHPHLRDSREVAHRFSVEAQAVAKLRHPNIVEVYDVSAEDEAEQYLVVELLRGVTLRKLLGASGAAPPEVAAAIGVELLGALGHAHAAGVIHRDIKPENVMVEHRPPSSTSAPHESGVSGRPSPVDQAGDRVRVKLTDFGIAKLLDAQGMTSTGQVLGSPAHMAPEQIEGGDVDARADIFGIGVLLYECMVGHLPFEGNNPAQVLRRVLDGVYPSADREKPTIGKTWSAILDRALARNQEDRYPDANAMREALLAELERLGVGSLKKQLEAWCDDPALFGEQHSKIMIERLCERALASSKGGDALAAAADYNRALAYAPNDPELLRIVASMHRAEERRRLFARAGPLVLGALAMGVIAFFVTRAVHSHTPVDKTLDPPRTIQTQATLGAIPVPVVSGTVSGATPSGALPPASTFKVAPAPAKPTTRDVVFGALHPSRNVFVEVDGQNLGEVTPGRSLSLDSSVHTLRFTCPKNVDGSLICDPLERTVEAGTRAEHLDVRLTIKPAILRVEGDPKRTYGIHEHPELRVISGEDTVVPLSDSASTVVHVIERETGRPITQELHAGKRVDVSFLDPPP
jgi:serine/threonine protein kinase